MNTENNIKQGEKMSTPHIEAKKEDIAKIVLMPGDPLRAKFFAEKNLKNYKLINTIRGMFGYTGELNGKKVTVMGHGMGLDSIGIYAYELYKFYNVEIIIRFGSCGSYRKDFDLFDVVVAENAFTESNYGEAFGWEKDTIRANQDLVDISKKVAKDKEYKIHFSTINSSMWFYQTKHNYTIEQFVEKGIDVVEMESYALYVIANALNKKALTILAASDNIAKKEETTSEQRRSGLDNMFSFLKDIVKNI